MLKKIRHQAIIDILSRRHIPNQAVLSHELEKLNHRVTQATISRDLAELNLVKDRHGYLSPSESAPGIRELSLSPLNTLRQYVVGLEQVKNLIVVRAVPGSANLVSMVLDSSDFADVVGAISSNNTVLTIFRSPVEAQKTRKRIADIIAPPLEGRSVSHA